MNELLGKISSYNLFNYLFCGVLFVSLSSNFTSYSFVQEDLVIGVFVYYFIGLVVSRIGSLVIEPFLKFFSFIKFEKYADFVTASKKDLSLDILSEVSNMYRTLSSVCLSVLFLIFYDSFSAKLLWFQDHEVYIMLIVLLLMFVFAYKKQTQYITKRIKTNIKDHE
jgi:hypothetical protein